MSKKDNKDEKDEQALSPEELLKSYLKDNAADHYNNEVDDEYTVSSGSLLLDIEMSGGIKSSVLRMSGVTEGGKTSASLAFMANFLKEGEKRRGVYIKAEGRLTQDMQDRSGISFTFDPTNWRDGMCFVYKCNVYESVINLIRHFITRKNNAEGIKYFFIIDSMDSLIPRGDVERPFDENNKVAGAALLSSDFLRKMALAFSSLGHICVMISQVRSKVSINPYEKTDPKITNASGGNAQLHYSDWILEFQQRWNDDIIWEGEKNKSPRLGHKCKIIFRKSANEKTGKEVEYPIKYGRKGGNSVWREREIVDLMLQFGQLNREKAWVYVDKNQSLIKEILEKFPTFPEKFNGINKVYDYFEADQPLTNFVFDRFKNTILGNETS